MAIKELKNKLSIKNRADIEMEKAFNKLRESYPEIAKKLEIIENASLPIEEVISDRWGDEI
ncbi:MAG TPA: hypothetical protein EYP22_05305 [Methanosarcinales archaeon]|nr:hypothetical protein [Methanosarcinales archaeon]